MPQTPNKGYEIQVTGSNVGTWGDVLNDNMISYVDLNLGGLVTKTLTNANVVLSASESRNAILRLIGTLTGAVQITTSCIGFFFVENLTTGAFAVTVTNGVAGVVVLQGTRVTLIADGTNGVRIASSSGFETGVAIIFAMAAAPIGWTKITAVNNSALRLVSGAGGVTGGSQDFTTAFQSQTPTGIVGGTALSISQMPLHGHPVNAFTGGATDFGAAGLGLWGAGPPYEVKDAFTGTPTATVGQTIGGAGGGQSHDHSWTGNAINLAVKYLDVIHATKD
jgi:hypothetical protein